MTYQIFIGDRTFSSWSLRGWLMLAKFGLPHTIKMVGLYSGSMQQDMAALAPARLVPVLRLPDGQVIGESLAIAETLHERHPDADLWPTDLVLRARARWLCAEMASGFSTLRSSCPMQLQHINEGFAVGPALRRDLYRIEEIWDAARALHTRDGPWIFGSYSLADVFFAPAAARIVGYDLPVSTQARDYCAATINDPVFQHWRAEGQKKAYDLFPYDIALPTRAWPT